MDWGTPTEKISEAPPLSSSFSSASSSDKLPEPGTACCVYSLRCAKNGNFVVAVGSGANEGKIFDPMSTANENDVIIYMSYFIT